MRSFVVAALVIASSAVPKPVMGQVLSGPAIAVDGDTLVMADERIRLFGIDAPEGAQTCQRGGGPWACGRDAAALLADLVLGHSIDCEPQGRDDYGRIVARCSRGGSDLAATMVREGLAVALPRFTADYVGLEAKAKALRMALWGSSFEPPAAFRSANPHLFRAPSPAPVSPSARRTLARAVPAAAKVAWGVFRNCAAARAAGAAPLYRGRPGYGSHLDADGDGVACEPYRGGG